MSKAKTPPPRRPGGANKVVSIVGDIARRRAQEAQDRAANTHLRELEASAEMSSHEAALQDMDLDAGIAWCEAESSREARISWTELRSLRALRSCMRGDTEAGLAEWEEVIAAEPKIAGTYLVRARWRSRTDLAAALADCERAVVAEPKSASGYARRGDYHRALGDSDRALADYRRAVGIDPSLYDTHYCMGTIFGARGEYKDALAAYDRAVRLAPRYVEFYLGRAATLECLGESARALRDLDRILELDPSREDIRSHRVLYLARIGRVDEAVEDMVERVEELSDVPEAHDLFTHLGGIQLAMGQREKAIEALSRALALAPDDVTARAKRGKAYWETGDYPRALDDLDRAVALAPDDPEHHVSRANALGKLDRMADAVVALSRAIELAPAHAGAHALRAIYGSHVAEDDEALAQVKADLGRAIELAPGEVVYVRKRAAYLMELGEIPAALADVEKALALAPGVAELYYERGFCKSRLYEWRCGDEPPERNETKEQEQERLTSALADLEKALELGLRNGDVYFELVAARQQMGDDEAYGAMLDRALAAAPAETGLLYLRYDRRRRTGDEAGAAADRAHLVETGFQFRDEG